MEGYRDLLDVARNEAGLENFGEDSFLEPLEILSGSIEREAKRSSSLGLSCSMM